MRISRKSLEKRPDRLGAVDVVVLRAEQVGGEPRKARIGRHDGHAMATAIDAVEQDIAVQWAALLDPGHGRPIAGVAILEVE